MSRFAARMMSGVPNVWTPVVLLAQAALQQRPSGAGYVRYEDLYQTGDTLQQVCARVPADGSGNPQILTLPNGTFGVSGMSGGPPVNIHLGTGGATHCGGIIGSGRGTIIKLLTNTTTDTGDGTYGTIIRVDSVSNVKLSNFQLQAEYQSSGGNQLYGGGIIVVNSHGAELSWLYLRGASPGYSLFGAPGETFGINVYRSNNVTIRDTEVDGRDLSNVRQSASPIGWNGSGAYPSINFATNARIYRTYCHHSKASMPTFWYTQNIYTEDLWSFANGSGTSNLAGHSINHEQCEGPITHVRPYLFVNNTNSTGTPPPYPLPDDTRTSNSGFHISLLSSLDDLGTSTTIIEPVWDKCYPGTGMFTIQARDTYNPPNGPNGSQIVTSPTIIAHGRTLQAKNYHSSGADPGWNTSDPAVYFSWVH